MSKIYPKVMDIRWRYDGENNQYITYLNPRTNNINILSPVAARIFELCDAKHTKEEIIDRIFNEFEVPTKEIVKGDVEDFLQFMHKDKMILLLKDS